MERWVPLLGYPGYSASDLGRIRNDLRSSILTPVKMRSEYVYVGLVKDGVQVKRAVGRLIAETFLPPPERQTFDTPIHLDGKLDNCKVENLVWRPRWFAVKHIIQFRRPLPYYPDPIREKKTGELFEDCWDAVIHYGLLYMDLVLSIDRKTYVFPTMQSYEWA